MATITTALERAKTYLILPDSTAGNTRVENALVPATSKFKTTYKRYVRAKNIPDEFTSVSVEAYGEDYVRVETTSSIIKKMSLGYELRVDSGTYEGDYEVLSINTTDNTFVIRIYEDFVDEAITFFNLERQIYEDALGWYICGFNTLTLQQLKECKVLITSTQVGEGSIEAYSISSITQFRRDMLREGDFLLKIKYYPKGH